MTRLRFRRRLGRVAFTATMMMAASAVALRAHTGPPIPVLTDHDLGRFVVSVWVDPDATDDGSAGGRAWVVLRTRNNTRIETRPVVVVAVRPRGVTAPPEPVRATGPDADGGNFFARVAFPHEGEFDLSVALEDGSHRPTAYVVVNATYASRPSIGVALLYLFPFVSVGVLWIRLVVTRRRHHTAASHQQLTPGPARNSIACDWKSNSG